MFDFDFDFFIDLFPIFGRRRRQRRGPPRRRPADRPPPISARRGALGALPFPNTGPTSTNPFPTGSTRPPFGTFPGGQPANDPIFRQAGRAARGAGRLLGPFGGLVIGGLEVLIAVVTGVQLETMADILREQDAAIDELQRRRRLAKTARAIDLEVEKRARALEQAPETFDPTPAAPTPAPAPRTIPSIDFPIPGVITLPIPSVIVLPGQSPIPSSAPSPAPSPAADPSTQPAGLPGEFGVPAPLPVPQTLPFPSPQLVPRPLTVVEPVSVPSPLPTIVPSFLQDPRFNAFAGTDPSRQPLLSLAPQTCPAPQRKCDDELDERRTECFKGLYREGVLDTTFTEWSPIDCITGREI